ncbi:hypothetical protein [Herbidospora mongoliensis]|uniref:hypothetical protein n=1 Tax=Herbidospora mongoliensis TaxID=688067 RepID=UPI001FDFA8CE|nr:hypothetical protein [Herbidospora mongoliensis]
MVAQSRVHLGQFGGAQRPWFGPPGGALGRWTVVIVPMVIPVVMAVIGGFGGCGYQ